MVYPGQKIVPQALTARLVHPCQQVVRQARIARTAHQSRRLAATMVAHSARTAPHGLRPVIRAGTVRLIGKHGRAWRASTVLAALFHNRCVQ